MTTTSRTRWFLWATMAVATALYVIWGLAPSLPLFTRLLTPHVLLTVAAVVKLAYLLAGTLWAFACRDRLEEGNPARPAWALLSIGLLATFVGQLSLAPFQIVLGTSPFPAVADLYYILAYPFLTAAFLAFLRAYRMSGLPMGSRGERVAIVTIVGVIAVAVGVPILRPVMAAEGALLDRLLTVAYPTLDLILLVPLSLLLRIAARLRGSQVGAIWGLLLGGLVFVCAGDVFFAYFTALGHEHLDPFLHATFILGYGLVASGALRQLQLLRS